MKNNEYFQAFHVHQPHAYWVEHFYYYFNVLLTKTGGQGEEEEEEEDNLVSLDTELFPLPPSPTPF